jgi:phenylalanyl-tRNA synthetase beta subunit
MRMHELKDYLFYDESFLRRLDWYPADAVAIKNPVSENWKVLVTSLIPHLIKNVELNAHGHEQINLFEHNNIWRATSEKSSIEHKSLAGIFFGNKDLNFYDYKAQLQQFFAMLQLPVVWGKPADKVQPWFDQLQVADLLLDGVVIGRAGMLCQNFVRPVIKGQGFIFECNADAIMNHKPKALKFTPWSKYQTVAIDISILVDVLLCAASLEQLILQADSKIDQVKLVDFFEKPEWAGKRSLTFRYRICDFEQNITKDVIDAISEKVVAKMAEQGAQIR